MPSSSAAGFEKDILDQPDALESCAFKPLSPGIASLDFGQFDRIILTGMGSSDYVTIPLELTLARAGLPVWRIQTNRLLETPELIRDSTMLWITSQSGRSGEVVELLKRLPDGHSCTVAATTNDPNSPLAIAADYLVELHSGPEATVSSKSYLNTLAWLHRVRARFQGRPDKAAVSEIMDVAKSLRAWISAPPPYLSMLAQRTLRCPNPRLALVGTGADSATALTGALILKEASKVSAEGYVGGEFRHGPMELAGPGLTALLFGSGSADDATLRQLARDLSLSGSIVVTIAPTNYEGAEHVPVPDLSDFGRMAHAMCALQQLSIALARGSGFVPGEFRFGQKITALL
ncbi:glucosamine--fructose-6-phosphate aminotransferase [Labrys miyagiensis]|uniref:Glutamine--fructose-6-phosphate aminotransferase [isomerizing] n=1 Tax=Labrys miyagiensis TaxID=346912 RepID=A0ABQ6CQP7_9HYPH|nr:SIS domain-containing protein [Labrys miyagiensis]GLS22676.1 glucosamine--fructose-6-phosphate aminotransferase [Labrys miyagiensis]